MATIPTFDQLFNPTLRALHDLGGSASIHEISKRVIENENLSDEVVDAARPGLRSRTELEFRLSWARTYLKQFGVIDNSARGIWVLTPKGVETDKVDPREVKRFVNAKTRKLEGRGGPGPEGTGGERGEEKEEEWKEQLLATLKEMEPDAFERLCQRLLRESGFIEVEVTGRSGDGGIDGHGLVRLAGLLSFPVLFQCKRWGKNVPASAVRDFRGAMMGRAENGLMLTTAGFTRDARREAARDGAPIIDLIDGDLLMNKLKELGLGVKTKQVEVVEVKTEWFGEL